MAGFYEISRVVPRVVHVVVSLAFMYRIHEGDIILDKRKSVFEEKLTTDSVSFTNAAKRPAMLKH